VVQTDARGETGATMEGMVEEKGILPERSEWLRSRRIIGTAPGQGVVIIGGYRQIEGEGLCDSVLRSATRSGSIVGYGVLTRRRGRHITSPLS
jgi:hypothetical protein